MPQRRQPTAPTPLHWKADSLPLDHQGSPKSLSQFEFIFVYGVRVCSNFIDLHQAVPTFPTPLAEETVFSPLYILASFFDG